MMELYLLVAKIGSFGSDAVTSDLTSSDKDWLKRKLKVAEIDENFDVSKNEKNSSW